jgi:hypothetical protein
MNLNFITRKTFGCTWRIKQRKGNQGIIRMHFSFSTFYGDETSKVIINENFASKGSCDVTNPMATINLE